MPKVMPSLFAPTLLPTHFKERDWVVLRLKLETKTRAEGTVVDAYNQRLINYVYRNITIDTPFIRDAHHEEMLELIDDGCEIRVVAERRTNSPIPRLVTVKVTPAAQVQDRTGYGKLLDKLNKEPVSHNRTFAIAMVKTLQMTGARLPTYELVNDHRELSWSDDKERRTMILVENTECFIRIEPIKEKES